MGTLKPTLTINDTTTFSDPVNFSVTDFDYPHNIKARVEETATIPF